MYMDIKLYKYMKNIVNIFIYTERKREREVRLEELSPNDTSKYF